MLNSEIAMNKYLPLLLLLVMSLGSYSGVAEETKSFEGYLQSGFFTSFNSEQEQPEFDVTPIFGWYASYNDWFFEKPLIGQEGRISLGFNLLENQDSSFDVLLYSKSFASFLVDTGLLDKDTTVDVNASEEDRNAGIVRRHFFSDAMPVGLRYRKQTDELNYLFRFLADAKGEEGFFLSINTQKEWQVRRWVAQIINQTDYYSKAWNESFFNISEQEATEKYTAYQAEASLSSGFAFAMEYPISIDKTFRWQAQHIIFPDHLRDSELMNTPVNMLFFSLTFVLD